MANRPFTGRRLYSDNTKRKIVNELVGGSTQAEIAHKFDVPRHLCRSVRDRFLETGTVENKPFGRPRKLDEDAHGDLVLHATENPNLTLKELGKSVEPNVSASTVRKELAEEGIHIQELREAALDDSDKENMKDPVRASW
jgi:transposase